MRLIERAAKVTGKTRTAIILMSATRLTAPAPWERVTAVPIVRLLAVRYVTCKGARQKHHGDLGEHPRTPYARPSQRAGRPAHERPTKKGIRAAASYEGAEPLELHPASRRFTRRRDHQACRAPRLAARDSQARLELLENPPAPKPALRKAVTPTDRAAERAAALARGGDPQPAWARGFRLRQPPAERIAKRRATPAKTRLKRASARPSSPSPETNRCASSATIAEPANSVRSGAAGSDPAPARYPLPVVRLARLAMAALARLGARRPGAVVGGERDACRPQSRPAFGRLWSRPGRGRGTVVPTFWLAAAADDPCPDAPAEESAQTTLRAVRIGLEWE